MTISLPPPHEPFVDTETGKINESWYRVLSRVVGPLRPLVLSSLPTTASIASGTWNLVKDSSGGTVRVAYNDAGTIKTVALTS